MRDYCDDITCPKGTYCQSGLCLPLIGFCESDGDCDAGFICNENSFCDVDIPVDPCQAVVCDTGSRCISGECVDNCLYSNCPAGTSCNQTDGNCYTDRFLCTDNGHCSEGQVCLLGKCYTPIQPSQGSPCTGVVCGEGKVCQGGICVFSDPCQDVSCSAGETCIQGLCVDACLTVNCGESKVCRLGSCVDICSTIQCPIGWTCQAGECQMT